MAALLWLAEQADYDAVSEPRLLAISLGDDLDLLKAKAEEIYAQQYAQYNDRVTLDWATAPPFIGTTNIHIHVPNTFSRPMHYFEILTDIEVLDSPADVFEELRRDVVEFLNTKETDPT